MDSAAAFIQSPDPEEFRKRQQDDQFRYSTLSSQEIRRRQPFHVRYDPKNNREPDEDNDYKGSESEEVDFSDKRELEAGEGEEGWRNSEGERLDDFGVDEDVEFYDEDDIPLGELLKRKAAM